MIVADCRRWGWRDSAVAALALLALLALAYRAQTHLNYHWDWLAPLRYIVSYEDGEWQTGLLVDGMLMSVRLLVFGGALALTVGALVAAMSLSQTAAMRWLARVYVEGLRHLPPIVFMFIFFYFISTQAVFLWEAILRVSDNAAGRALLGDPALAENLISGVLCLAMFEAAFFSEILRAGVLSVERGQWDAARSVGLSSWQVLRLVIIPQVAAKTAAPLVGQMILLIKNSAILSVISVQDLTFTAVETAVSSQRVFETWIIVSIFYFLLCYPLLRIAKRLERRA